MNIKNLKILELASVLAGPQVGSFFSELGASVIKIENETTGGDVTRNWKLNSENEENSISAYYASANYNKKSVFLNFNKNSDKETLNNHIRNSDVIISNFKYGDAEKFALSFTDCKRLNPRIIYGEITGFGKNDKRSAFDVILQAETGYISMTGNNENNLAKLPVAFIDLFAAHQLKEGLLLALLENRKPVCVSVSLYDSAIAALANQASNFLMEGFVPKPIGTQHPNIAPYGDIYLTMDKKKIILAAGTEKQFISLLKILDKKEIPSTLLTNKLRVKNRVKLNSFLALEIGKITVDKFISDCYLENVPVGKIKSLNEVFEKPKATKLILNETVEGIETKRVKTVVFTFSS